MGLDDENKKGEASGETSDRENRLSRMNSESSLSEEDEERKPELGPMIALKEQLEKDKRLSSQQKGKSVAATSAPARNPDGGCIGDLESAHHTAMMDTVNLSRSQRLLVADAMRLAREGSENVAVRDATECARDGQSGAAPVDSITLRARADRIARREWRSDLSTVLPIRTKRLDVFPRDIQKQVSEAKRMGTLPDLSAMLAAQLGLTSGEGPSTAVPRVDEVPPSDSRNAGKGRKRKRGGSGIDGSVEKTSVTPPSGEGDVQEEELRPEEEVLEGETSGEKDNEEEAIEEEESEASLGAAHSGDPEEEAPARPNNGAVQIGTSSRGDAVLRRVPGVSFPDKDLIFGGEYEEAARAKLLGDSAMNIVVDKYDTALKGALKELELAKKEFAEKEEASVHQLNASRADVRRLNGIVTRTIARRDELKAELEASQGVVRELERKNAELERVFHLRGSFPWIRLDNSSLHQRGLYLDRGQGPTPSTAFGDRIGSSPPPGVEPVSMTIDSQDPYQASYLIPFFVRSFHGI
ncbi:hypothetical protein F2Q70_00032206 [Brassica cretica]|uniref:Uncharacterized protein n=1 Tax=Brassica cretica TaxID=69181 RepID=A0A8S9FK87_BRACR|nr:hypothetical protein F2Q70_00032206 [Brassica cretica]